MNDKISLFCDAVNKAQSESNKFKDEKDLGTCNLDTVIIDFSGWRQKSIDRISFNTGIDIGNRMTGLYNGYRFVFFKKNGFASCRTKMAEIANESLIKDGIKSTVWYQMD